MLISHTTRSCSKTVNIADRFLGNPKKIDAFGTHRSMKIDAFNTPSSTRNWVSRPDLMVKMEEFRILIHTNVIMGSRFMIYQFLSDHWSVPLSRQVIIFFCLASIMKISKVTSQIWGLPASNWGNQMPKINSSDKIP